MKQTKTTLANTPPDPLDALTIGAACARVGNKVLNLACNIALLLLLLFGVYSLADTWSIFSTASISASLLSYKPVVVDTTQPNPTIQELAEIYPDARAWLTIDDTKIDYPVVQSTNNTHYVNYDMDGSFSLSGAIFLDYKNSGDFSDLYSIVYGHHMDLQAMFGGLDLFVDEDYLNSHTVGYLFLPECTEVLEIFAYISVDATDDYIFGTNLDDPDQQAATIAYIEENATVYRDIGLQSSDRIVALATCSTAGTNQRTVVLARIVD